MDTDAIKKNKFWAGAILYHPEKRAVLLQHRDTAAPVNPNTWALFGGVGEVRENPDACLRRELGEELGYDFSSFTFTPLHDYLIESLGMWRYVYWSEMSLENDQLALGEGAGFDWMPLHQALKLQLAGVATRRDIEAFMQLLQRREGYEKVYVWEATPSEEDPDHEHPFDTQIIVVKGSIEIGQAGANRILEIGDTIFVPRGTKHWGKAGSAGCRYIVAEKHH